MKPAEKRRDLWAIVDPQDRPHAWLVFTDRQAALDHCEPGDRLIRYVPATKRKRRRKQK